MRAVAAFGAGDYGQAEQLFQDCVARKLHDDILKATTQTSAALQADLNNLRSTATRRVQQGAPMATPRMLFAIGRGSVTISSSKETSKRS